MEQNTGMINKRKFLKKKIGILVCSMLFLLMTLVLSGCSESNTSDSMESAIPQETVDTNSVQESTEETPGAVGSVVDIDSETAQNQDKMVAVSMDAVGRANPFVPATESFAQEVVTTNQLPKFELVEPPMGSDTDSDAAKVVTTKISGIMFDKYNPSAIINIEDTDYLVRSGDVINGYKILAISPQTVTVQLGSNIYKAGVGEIVTKEDGIKYNQISNLSKKFGGAANNKK